MNQILIEGKFAGGAFRDKYDLRDKKYVARAGFPFDWQKGYDVEEELSKILNIPNFKLLPKDQDGSSSCGGQAGAMYNAILEAEATKTWEERSAKYIYAQGYVPGGGMYGRDIMKIIKKQGVAREVVLSSYENGNPPSEKFMQRSQDITIEARNDAKNAKIRDYGQVNPDIETVAQAIRDNWGVIIGVTGENNGTWLSLFPKPPTKGELYEWRHWVYAGKAKLIDGKKCIGILNSWGKIAGENGWQWLGENYFNTKVSDGNAVWNSWTMLFDEAPPEVTLVEKKTDLLHSLIGLYYRLLEALQESLVGQWIGGIFSNEWAKTGGAPRSPDWNRIRKAHIKLYPLCAIDNKKGTLLKSNEVHHILPFHEHPELELEPKNFITLCRAHHLEWGHFYNFKSWNSQVKKDAELWRKRVANRP